MGNFCMKSIIHYTAQQNSLHLPAPVWVNYFQDPNCKQILYTRQHLQSLYI